ncbi:unnamed protein product [Cylicocyclus nassatus]|uniref:Delta-like protein n=1 Tax=Cylicocyclus nassatus TaxID=53992 RepID=A0AA36DNJ2_CYLNA|nr:unnamed protein product [Cylicocyclus nassatus]
MMHFTALFTAAFLIPTLTANLYSSGMFLVRISSERRHRIHYCFTELPYTLEMHQKGRCLKSGQVDVARQTEKVIDLRLMNVSTAYLTLEFTVPAKGFGPPKKVAERVIVDGALPAKRIAVGGLFINFVTICDRPWYGLMCARYCIEHENAHYVCDPRGEKVCLVGWTGTDCDIAKEAIFPMPFETTDASPPPAPPPENPIPSTSTGRLTTEVSGSAIKATTTVISSLSGAIKEKKTTTTTNTAMTSTTVSTSQTVITNSKTTVPPTRQGPTSRKESSLKTYAMRNPSTVRDSTTSSTEEIVLLIILPVIALILLGYLLIVLARHSSVQNWINSQKAKIFASSCSTRSDEEVEEETLPKVFAIDINKNSKKIETFDSSEKLGPRYSSQPTSGATRDTSTHDVSVVESNMYHEIDSFLVPPVVDLRIATLV